MANLLQAAVLGLGNQGIVRHRRKASTEKKLSKMSPVTGGNRHAKG
jgi:hypothetical protein